MKMDIPPDIDPTFAHPGLKDAFSCVVHEYFSQETHRNNHDGRPNPPPSSGTSSNGNADESNIINSDDEDDNTDMCISDSEINIKSPVVQARIRTFLMGNSKKCDNMSDSDEPPEVETTGPCSSLYGSDMCESAQSDAKQLASQIEKGCNMGCLKKFDSERIVENRLNMQELEKYEKDLIIMGQLQACGLSKGNKTRTGERKRHRFSYQFDNETICVECFIYINSISTKYLKNIRSHLYTHGVVPRKHGNTGRQPHNALKFDDAQHVVQFIIGYADRYGMSQPAARGITDIIPPIYLPAQDTYDSMHKKYLDIAVEMDFRSMSEPSFRNIWKQCVPHIQFLKSRTDVCHICENFRKGIQEAETEDVKLKLAQSFADHIQNVQLERDYYKNRCKDAELEMKNHVNGEELKCVHYTFDFAQSVLVPGHVRQEGAIYYKSPFKVNWFGVLNDGKPAMYSYIFSEAESMGVDNESSHSSSSVVSMFDNFLSQHGEGEKKCFINCDNCGGQNKNQTLIGYCSWRTMLGYHEEINLHFMQPYHARCQIDGMFGLGRQKLRKHDVDSVAQVAEVLSKSCRFSKVLTYRNDSSGDTNWIWRDWKTFLGSHFRAVPGGRQYFHFKFLSSNPGHVIVKRSANSEEIDVRLLKRGKLLSEGNLPVRIEAAGLSPTRQWYLYHNVRNVLPTKYQDVTAPKPSVPEPKSKAVEE